MGKMFEMLKEGLTEAIEYEKGKRSLRTKRIAVPDAPKHYNATNIKKLRSHLGISQNDFALWLNVSPNTIKSWEQNIRRPNHSALRLLEVFEKGFPQVKKILGVHVRGRPA
jgi:putative transcriptional regulator